MAHTREEVLIDARPEDVWAAARDVGALHTRLVPGFVVDTRIDGEARIVTFGNGTVVREPILSIDDDNRRLAWLAVGGLADHYSASLQVLAQGTGARVVWLADFLPHQLAATIQGMQAQGLAIMKRTLESRVERA